MTKTPLTVHNAEIRTATVEIKTLTVSGKQVTLAVFRQLPRRPLIAKDKTLNGEPWGIVNYHPDKACARRDRHLHVVWQDGPELCRDEVEPPVVEVDETFWTQGRVEWLESAVLDGWRPSGSETSARQHGFRVRFEAGVLEISRDLVSQPVWSALWPSRGWSGTDEERAQYAEARRAEALKELQEKVAARRHTDGLDHESLTAQMQARIADERAGRQRDHDQWNSIRNLPQLFIAV